MQAAPDLGLNIGKVTVLFPVSLSFAHFLELAQRWVRSLHLIRLLHY